MNGEQKSSKKPMQKALEGQAKVEYRNTNSEQSELNNEIPTDGGIVNGISIEPYKVKLSSKKTLNKQFNRSRRRSKKNGKSTNNITQQLETESTKKSNPTPYSIYTCDESWLIAAKSIKVNAHHAAQRVSLDLPGLSTEGMDEFEQFVIENKSNEPTYNPPENSGGDDVHFFHIYNLLNFISLVREYNYHVPPQVGRQLAKYNRLEAIEEDIDKKHYMEHLNRFKVFGPEQKKRLKKHAEDLFKNNIESLVDDSGDYLKYFNTHPAVSLFIKTLTINRIYMKYDPLHEPFSMDKVTAFINHFNFIFDQKGYKSEVGKRLFNVIENIKAATRYINYHVELGTPHVVRFCLGFNGDLDDEYDRGYENKLKEKYKTFIELKDFKLNSLIRGRDAIFRAGKKRAVMNYVDGYLWKIDYCSLRGYYLHVFLFLDEDWKSSFNIMEEIGGIWRGAVSNGDVFVYGNGKGKFNIKNDKQHQKLIDEVTKLFNQDVLAYVNTTLSDGKKQRIFGKGVMYSKR